MVRARDDAMVGPRPAGFWSSHSDACWKSLRAGGRYRVWREFVDFDGTVHPVGEVWTFLGGSFLPYEDGHSWFVSLDDAQEWHIRLQCRPGTQAAIINDWEAFVVPWNP